MKRDLFRPGMIAAALALGLLTACDAGPSEPPEPSLTDAAMSFIQLDATNLMAHEDSVETACFAGGTRIVEVSLSTERQDDVVVRRNRFVTRFVDCGLWRNGQVITTNGEMVRTGETHLVNDQAMWPDGVLYQEGRQLGTLTLEDESGDVETCEYDLVEVSRPAEGYFSFKGTACGVAVDREIVLQRR